MPTLAVKILDPAGQQWAHLLDDAEPIRRLIPLLVERLGLPDSPSYQLVEPGDDRVLPVDDTLVEAGIRGGEALLLRPVKDGVLAAFLDALYDEALGYAAGKAFDKALASLESLYRLDPDYPDREGLWRKVARAGVTGGGAGAAATPPRSAREKGRRGGAPPADGAAGLSASGSAGRASRAAGQAAQANGSCLLRLVAIVAIGTVGVWFSGGCDRVQIDLAEWPPVRILDPGGEDGGGDGGQDTTAVVDDVVVRTGDVRVTLQWDPAVDLDLHVTGPGEQPIYYGNQTSPSGGELDVDANGGCDDDPRVENVYWDYGEAPSGTYLVEVDHYSRCTLDGQARYTVTAYVGGREVDRQSGSIGPGGRVQAFRFTR